MDKIELVKERYFFLFPGKNNKVKNYTPYMQQQLDIVLPRDFIEINNFFEGSCLGYGLFSFDNVIEKTLFYRNCQDSLPHHYLALGESDVSFVVLDTIDSKVIEMAITDYGNLVEKEPLLDNPQYFDSYTDFFEYLLDEEEKLRAEDVQQA